MGVFRRTDSLKLVKSYKAVFFREDEGGTLCKDHQGIKADHMLDPTILLKVEDYAHVTSPLIVKENYIFVYWLVSEVEKQKAITRAKIGGKKLMDILSVVANR